MNLKTRITPRIKIKTFLIKVEFSGADSKEYSPLVINTDFCKIKLFVALLS